jgi:hypothetical protein
LIAFSYSYLNCHKIFRSLLNNENFEFYSGNISGGKNAIKVIQFEIFAPYFSQLIPFQFLINMFVLAKTRINKHYYEQVVCRGYICTVVFYVEQLKQKLYNYKTKTYPVNMAAQSFIDILNTSGIFIQ